MKLIINTPGTYISKVGECFQIKNDNGKHQISAKKVEQILISTAAALTTDVLELAVENNIDVVFLKNTGKPYGRVWHSKLGSVSTIRRKQLKLNEVTLGVELVKEWLGTKIEDQMEHLTKLSLNRGQNTREFVKDAIDILIEQKKKISRVDTKHGIDKVRGTLQGYEGYASKVYFDALSKLIPDKYTFDGRSRNPAKDYFNCMLNYGYGILYSSVEKSCIIAGLDPYIGLMHVDNYNRKAFTFDLIEIYRGIMDKVVFRLFSTKKIKDEHFDNIEGGYYLNKEGKQLLIGEYNKLMEKKIKYKGRNIEMQNIIQYDCHQLANIILKEVK
ncbi:CRISPR-associated endonuclease Cas1 [Vallitalea sediminicola]